MQTHANILSFLSQAENKQYLANFTRRTYQEKNLVSDKETHRGGVFIVLSGRLRVYLSYEGREFTLLFLEPGDIFSMHSEALIEARERTEILLTDVEGFKELLGHVPTLSIASIALLGRVLMNSTHIIEDLMFRDVRARLLRFLIETAERKGRPTAAGIEIPLDLHTEEVAMLIGSTRQSTSSILNELIKEGHLIRVDRHTIVVKDLASLRHLRDEPPKRRNVEPPRKRSAVAVTDVDGGERER